MRINIVLDDGLVQEAMSLGHLKTKRELVELALREFVAFRKRMDVRELKGSGLIDVAYDYKHLRAGERTN